MSQESSAEPRVQRARLASELRRLRLLSGLSGRELAERIGVSQATVSRMENAHTVPSLPQVEAWAEAVDASEEARTALVALTEAALNELERWRVRLQEGLPAMQAEVGRLEASARSHRGFQPTLVFGLLQTAAYAQRVFEIVDVREESEATDHGDAVTARLERQQILYDEDRHFEFVLTEAALRWRPGPPRLLLAQLDRVSSVSTLEHVSLGVIPTGVRMRALPWCGFHLLEDLEDEGQPLVELELPHAGLTVTEPSDVEIYREQLDLLRESAVFDEEARELLRRISDDLRALPSD